MKRQHTTTSTVARRMSEFSLALDRTVSPTLTWIAVVASYLLPTTKAMCGRKSKQASHKLYRTDLAERYAKGAIQFHDPSNKAAGKAMLLEVRIGGGDRGAQTVFPGSVHESGEPIEWENGYDGEALEIDGEALYRA